MNPDDETQDEQDALEVNEIDYTDVSDISTWPTLDTHVAQLLAEGSDDAWADARRGPSEGREANLANSVAWKKQSEWVADTGVVRPEDLEALRETGRSDAIAVADEYDRREKEAEEAAAQAAAEAALTDEQRSARAAEDAAFAEAQKREDDIQTLVDVTAEALVESAAPKVQVNLFADDEGGDRLTTVTTGEGDEAVSTVGLGKAEPFDAAYKTAVRNRTGLFAYKDLADEVTSLPPAARGDWWAQRSDLERDVLNRAFGVREPVTAEELRKATEGSE